VVVIDVLTPHVKPYYDDANSARPITHPPAEYHNPVPVRFLAVEQTPFHAILTGPRIDVDAVFELLRVAADEWGLGGKTAAGYGYCTVTDMTAQEPSR
jgi:CRISPR-associated protein Cmr6